MLGGIDAVHDGVDAVQRRVEPVAGLHVPDDVLDVGAEVLPPPAAQNADIFAGGRQMLDDDAANGARATGYQYRVRHILMNRADQPDVTIARQAIAICLHWLLP